MTLTLLSVLRVDNVLVYLFGYLDDLSFFRFIASCKAIRQNFVNYENTDDSHCCLTRFFGRYGNVLDIPARVHRLGVNMSHAPWKSNNYVHFERFLAECANWKTYGDENMVKCWGKCGILVPSRDIVNHDIIPYNCCKQCYSWALERYADRDALPGFRRYPDLTALHRSLIQDVCMQDMSTNEKHNAGKMLIMWYDGSGVWTEDDDEFERIGGKRKRHLATGVVPFYECSVTRDPDAGNTVNWLPGDVLSDRELFYTRQYIERNLNSDIAEFGCDIVKEYKAKLSFRSDAGSNGVKKLKMDLVPRQGQNMRTRENVHILIDPSLGTRVSTLDICVGYANTETNTFHVKEFLVVEGICSFLDQKSAIHQVIDRYPRHNVIIYVNDDAGNEGKHIAREFRMHPGVTFYWDASSRPGFRCTPLFLEETIVHSPWRDIKTVIDPGTMTTQFCEQNPEHTRYVAILKHFAFRHDTAKGRK